MVDKPFILPQPIRPIGKPQTPPRPEQGTKTSFNEVLEKEIQQGRELKFSRHAQERMDTRQISLNKQQMHRLQEAVSKAEKKGCKESLVLLDDLAFVVSVKNKTVITAVDGEKTKENVFTNIDSAVIS